MDEQTVSAYNAASKKYAQDWRDQAAPQDMCELLARYFHGKRIHRLIVRKGNVESQL